VEGDICEPNLGLGDEERSRLQASVDLVVHCAAVVDFEPAIRTALESNLDGALHVATFAAACAGARMLHVSTCYVAGLGAGEVAERVNAGVAPNGRSVDAEAEYAWVRGAIAGGEERARVRHFGDRRDPGTRLAELPDDDREEIERWIDDETRDAGRERALSLGWPNTYTYTKALAERLILARHPDLRVAIVRPSIVESALEFPFAGWNEGFNTCGPLAFLVGTWFKALPAAEKTPFDVIPVDLVARGMLIASAALLADQAHGVYQLGSSHRNPITLGRALELTSLEQRTYLRARGETLVDRVVRSRWDTVAAPERHPLSLGNVVDAMTWTAERLLDLPKSTPASWAKEAATTARKLNRQRRKVRSIDDTVKAFVPFIRDTRQTYRTSNASSHGVVDARFVFDPERIDWRAYWLGVHMPGMRRWCFPKYEGDESISSVSLPARTRG
jgi:nucleoside-diphosphate-sugar epimerase